MREHRGNERRDVGGRGPTREGPGIEERSARCAFTRGVEFRLRTNTSYWQTVDSRFIDELKKCAARHPSPEDRQSREVARQAHRILRATKKDLPDYFKAI